MELDGRKQTILRAVVFEYVRCVEPVGSEMLAAKYDLGVKSATIRNELADLAEMGYLDQPHTSAGRIPSDLGYRYFVDRLIVGQDVDAEKRKQLRDVAEEGDVLQELLNETTRALSRLTHLLTAATVVRDPNLSIRSILVSALGPKQALLVVALSNGSVHNRMIEMPSEMTLTDLGAVNEILSHTLNGVNVRTASKSKLTLAVPSQSAEKVLALVMSGLRGVVKEASKVNITTEGEEFLFGQPEFQRDVGALSELIDSLKESDLLADAMTTDHAQTVTIGREHRDEKLHQLSVVRQRFYIGSQEAGTIAVIGPTRMAYDSSIPLINFTARALSESLTRFLG